MSKAISRWLRALFGGKKPCKEKKTWGGLVKSFREKDKKRQEAVPYEEMNRSGNNNVYDDEEQNKRAIAVAAATAAVAEVAVAAAQAAAAVVRLTSSGRMVGGKRAELAAVKIQSSFRAYLARRALRALKGLVKLQAIVRGNIVRKQAAETLRCMHALVRVQAHARARRALSSDRDRLKSSSRSHIGLITPEKSERSGRSNSHDRSSSPLKRNAAKQTSSNEMTSGLRWLDQWVEERYYDTASSGLMVTSSQLDDEKNAKILEIDSGKPNYNSKRKTNYLVHSSDNAMHDSTIPSPSSIDMQLTPSPLNFPVINACDFRESPQLCSVTSSRRGPFTPTKSECSQSLFSGYSDYPNYMANTESSRAKVRSQSAPKQRPDYEKSSSITRFSGGGHGLVQHSRSTSYKAYPGSGRLDRLGMPIRG